MPRSKLSAPEFQPHWPRDRAAVMATAVEMISQAIPDPKERLAAIAEYLRDAIHDIEQHAIHTNSLD